MNFKALQTAQKLRGGYYTPADLAYFLAKWAVRADDATVLEPSCGDGVFFDAIASFSKSATVSGFELDPSEAARARVRARRFGVNANVRASDFLEWAISAMEDGKHRFDAVVGNPPFIRYQYLPPDFQTRAERIFSALNCRFTKHTNAWVPFILASVALLRPGGRLAMVVPAEIIHVLHAQSLRSYLGEVCRRMVVIDPEELWFDNTLQGAVLLLAEKKARKGQHGEGVAMYPVRNREFLTRDAEELFREPQSINGKTVAGKWTRALLDPTTRSLLDGLCDEGIAKQFVDIASVDVGIVTGANKYFLVDDSVVEEYKLEKWAHPMFGRSEHCPGIIYDEKQHKKNAQKGNPTNFVWLPNESVEKSKTVREYIEFGKKQSLHTRYKCRIRSPWYTVPSVYATEIGMLKRAHDTPRLILNKLRAYTTDTAYRVTSTACAPERLVYSFINGLTALSAELEGRHYGGGVLELVPSEIERLLIPLSDNVEVKLGELDERVRKYPADVLLKEQTAATLGVAGVSRGDQERLLAGWRRLRDRRQRVSTEELEVDAS